jgi:hypothetical protein
MAKPWSGGRINPTVNLYTDGKAICAIIGPDPVQGIFGER